MVAIKIGEGAYGTVYAEKEKFKNGEILKATVRKTFNNTDNYSKEKAVIEAIRAAAKKNDNFRKIINEYTLIDTTSKSVTNDKTKTVQYNLCNGINLNLYMEKLKIRRPQTNATRSPQYVFPRKAIRADLVLLAADAMLKVFFYLHKYCEYKYHGDWHLGNLMLCDSNIKVIDFGEAYKQVHPTTSYVKSELKSIGFVLKELYSYNSTDFDKKINIFIEKLDTWETVEKALNHFLSEFESELAILGRI